MGEFDEKDDWEGLTIGPHVGGINTFIRADRIADGEAVKVTNLTLEKDRVVIDSGYATFSGVVRGNPRCFHDFISRDGSRRPVLVTNDTVYRYVSSEWQYIAGDASTHTSATAAAAATSIVVDDITDFADNDYIGIILDDGTQHQTQVNGAPAGSTITFDDAIPAGRSVGLDAVVVNAVVLTGIDSVSVRFDVYSAFDWFTFTNGINPPKRYDNNNCIDIPGLSDVGHVVCRDIKVFTNHLLLLNVTQDGVARPQRVRWSNTGDPTNWTTANSGFEDLLNDPYIIMGAESLGPYLIIYKDNSIIRCSYAGSLFRLFYFETMVSDEGTISPGAIIKADDRHIFMGRENVYIYAGGMDLKTIGNGIYYDVMGKGGDLNPQFQRTTLGIYVKNNKEVWFAYPSGASTDPDKLIKIRIDTGAWVTREFNHTIVGWGMYTTSNYKSWGELTGTWGDQTWRWGAQPLTAGAAHIMLCGNNNQVYEYDYADSDDAGTGIAYTLETKELYHERLLTRVDMISMYIRGSALVTLEYSEDGGGTWTIYGTTTPGASFTTIEIYKQIISKRLRFRLTGTGGNFGLEWLYMKSSTESEW